MTSLLLEETNHTGNLLLRLTPRSCLGFVTYNQTLATAPLAAVYLTPVRISQSIQLPEGSF